LSPERIAAIDRTIANVDRSSASLKSASERVDRLVTAGGDDLLDGIEDFRYVMATLSRYAEPVGQDASLSARDLRDFARQIRANPGVLLRSGVAPADDIVPPLRAATSAP
ncbi:MAG TPA: hypothetical protein VJM11_00165, partial [Nevskiaceae bacterium]|nr:hypothetical protein [Nevskiaceae bacterium]